MKISIKYCTVWNHLPRVVTLIQNILGEHMTKVSSFELIPGNGGIFEVYANGNLIFSRENEGRLPDDLEIENLIKNLL